ncbi:hypothetical protein IWX90DRAFT_486960 [Phyllosticta citrichinensis]|uniref:Uncharacterized protein n=1 Tax=Phyllosticta citrichinensis TaxID=1130410 RepID=A0ABR1XUZ4_9PEZI
MFRITMIPGEGVILAFWYFADEHNRAVVLTFAAAVLGLLAAFIFHYEAPNVPDGRVDAVQPADALDEMPSFREIQDEVRDWHMQTGQAVDMSASMSSLVTSNGTDEPDFERVRD